MPAGTQTSRAANPRPDRVDKAIEVRLDRGPVLLLALVEALDG